MNVVSLSRVNNNNNNNSPKNKYNKCKYSFSKSPIALENLRENI